MGQPRAHAALPSCSAHQCAGAGPVQAVGSSTRSRPSMGPNGSLPCRPCWPCWAGAVLEGGAAGSRRTLHPLSSGQTPLREVMLGGLQNGGPCCGTMRGSWLAADMASKHTREGLLRSPLASRVVRVKPSCHLAPPALLLGAVWGYWSTDGLGLFEYMLLAEELGAEPVWVINNGVAHGDSECSACGACSTGGWGECLLWAVGSGDGRRGGLEPSCLSWDSPKHICEGGRGGVRRGKRGAFQGVGHASTLHPWGG